MTFDRTLEVVSERGRSVELPARAHLFLVMECQRPLSAGMRFALDGVDTIAIGRGATRAYVRDGHELRIDVPDPRMSSRHARIVRTESGFELEDLGSTNGTRVDGDRVNRALLRDGSIAELASTLFVLRTALATPSTDRSVVDGARLLADEALATLVPTYTALLTGLVRVALSDVPVLLLGESGSGKEVLARAVHTMSMRKGAFVPVNCGALPETLIEGQLFGHARGAFSGAVRDEVGLVRASDGGTLFLDEIGDLPKTSQAALLRVLQEREVMPVGATRAVKVDLRVVAATHRRVDVLQEEGDFRSDLYARLAGFTFDLPPLRERREDVGVLVAALLRRLAPDRNFTLSTSAGAALLRYTFPLNVRELHQALSVALVLAGDGNVIELAHLPEPMRRARSLPPPRVALTNEDDELRVSLTSLLQTHQGNVSIVARELGKTRMQIHRWMKRFGIDPESFRR